MGSPVEVYEAWYVPSELAGLPGLPTSVRRVNSRAKREGWESRRREGRGGGREYAFASLPEATQVALLRRYYAQHPPQRKDAPTQAELDAAWARWDAAKNPMKETAKLRLTAVHAVHDLVSHGVKLSDARAHVVQQMADEAGVEYSARSIARWEKQVLGADSKDWLALLLPAYGGGKARTRIPPDAWEIFKADWLRVEQPSASSCYDRLQRIAATKDWPQLPSLRTFERRLKRDLPHGMRVLARQGEEAMARTYPAQERDRSGFEALQAVNADGHRWDIMVNFPDGTIGRPLILGWQDIYSGKILAWRLTDTESSDAVRLSLMSLIERYGVPGEAWLDNGRAFASKWMTGGMPNRYRFKVREEDPVGVMTSVGIKVHWVTPYHGQAKPIERAWRDFCDRIAKHPAFAGAYTGNKPTAKPENYGSRAVAWDDFVRVVNEEIAAHNARAGRRTAVCQGRSFDETFAASYQRSTVRRLSDAQLRQLMLAAKAVTADRHDGSVRLAGNRYWTEALAPHAGQKLVLRIDPQHLHGSAHVYTLAGTYIAEAPCLAPQGFADQAAAREHSRAKTRYRKAQRKMLEAERAMDAAEVAAQLPAPPPEDLPPASIIEGIFRQHGKPAAPVQPIDDQDKATGTDGVTALDRWAMRQAERLNEDRI